MVEVKKALKNKNTVTVAGPFGGIAHSNKVVSTLVPAGVIPGPWSGVDHSNRVVRKRIIE